MGQQPPAAPAATGSAPRDGVESAEQTGDTALLSHRGWLGVELASTDRNQAGVLVRSVIPGSPAERGGIVPGDVIVRIDGQNTGTPRDIVGLVGERASGERVSVALKRGPADRLLSVTLAPRPDDDAVQRMRYVGLPAPDFDSLELAQGSTPMTLRALRGKVVVLEFWSPWCSVCRLLIPVTNDWYGRYSAQGVAVIGITTESVVRAAGAARQLGIAHPVLSDETAKTTIAYRAMSIPTVFLIDRRGVVRDVMVGYYEQRLTELQALIERLLAEP